MNFPLCPFCQQYCTVIKNFHTMDDIGFECRMETDSHYFNFIYTTKEFRLSYQNTITGCSDATNGTYYFIDYSTSTNFELVLEPFKWNDVYQVQQKYYKKFHNLTAFI